MDSPDVVSLYVTTPDAATAERLGRSLVDESLAACANVVPTLVSIYRWQGSIERAEEALLFVKTRADLAEEAARRLVELHPYEVPCVVVLPVTGGHGPFLEWVRGATQGRPG